MRLKPKIFMREIPSLRNSNIDHPTARIIVGAGSVQFVVMSYYSQDGPIHVIAGLEAESPGETSME